MYAEKRGTGSLLPALQSNPVSHEIRSEETILQIAITLHANI